MDEQLQLEEVHAHSGMNSFEFQTTASFGQDAAWWALQPPMALVIGLPDDPALAEYYYEKLRRDVPRSTRVLFLCPVITPGLMQVSGLFEKVRILKTPTAPFFLYRSLVELTTEYPPEKSQSHPRYLTDQAVQVYSDLRRVRVDGRMKNLSIGGMYFLVAEMIPSFHPGDLISAGIDLNGKNYLFDLKVVWSRSDQETGSTGYGCMFLSREQVYDTLLSQVAR